MLIDKYTELVKLDASRHDFEGFLHADRMIQRPHADVTKEDCDLLDRQVVIRNPEQRRMFREQLRDALKEHVRRRDY